MNHILRTISGGGQSPENPGFRIMNGFARVLRLERTELKFATFALDPATQNVDHKADLLVRIICQLFTAAAKTEYEREDIEIPGSQTLKSPTPLPFRNPLTQAPQSLQHSAT